MGLPPFSLIQVFSDTKFFPYTATRRLIFFSSGNPIKRAREERRGRRDAFGNGEEGKRGGGLFPHLPPLLLPNRAEKTAPPPLYEKAPGIHTANNTEWKKRRPFFLLPHSFVGSIGKRRGRRGRRSPRDLWVWKEEKRAAGGDRDSTMFGDKLRLSYN